MEERNFEGVIDGQLEVELEYLENKITELTEKKKEIKEEQKRRSIKTERKNNEEWGRLALKRKTTV